MLRLIKFRGQDVDKNCYFGSHIDIWVLSELLNAMPFKVINPKFELKQND